MGPANLEPVKVSCSQAQVNNLAGWVSAVRPIDFGLNRKPVQVLSSSEAGDLNGLSGLDPAARRSVVVPV